MRQRLCGYRKNLNQLVNRLGDEEMKKEWWELSFGPRTSKKDPEWKGIQNRRTPHMAGNFINQGGTFVDSDAVMFTCTCIATIQKGESQEQCNNAYANPQRITRPQAFDAGLTNTEPKSRWLAKRHSKRKSQLKLLGLCRNFVLVLLGQSQSVNTI